MFWKAKNNIFRRVTVRLTLWYLVIFTLLLIILFSAVEYSLSVSLKRRIDNVIVQHFLSFNWIDDIYNDAPGDKVNYKISTTFYNTAGNEKNYHIFFVLLSTNEELKCASNLYRWEKIKTTILEVPYPVKNQDTTLAGRRIPETRLQNLYYTHLADNSLIAFKTITTGIQTRVGYRKFNDGNYLIIGVSYKQDAWLLTMVQRIFLVAFAVLLLTGGLLSYTITKKAMNGVTRVTNTATSIGQGNLQYRVPLGREGVEVENLAIAFNTMLDKINSLFLELKQVTNNIAHDLRSPITGIRGMAETTATRNSTADDYKLTLGMIVEECDQLIAMVNTMLDIAELESGVMKLNTNPVDLNIILKELCELYNYVAEDRGIHFTCRSSAQGAMVTGDSILLKRVFTNIVDNAFKFTVGGNIDIAVENPDHQVTVTVTDSGVGISPEDLPHIFERFYRGDASRSTKGNGLGLCLALGIVQAHGGDIQVSSTPKRGSRFHIILPASS
ncbi:MAG TPA: HAMP domain-containing sensor histidine kinase [bacterium]|nr:HAMP domain-containing sensor histidine kinase [bacterium]HPN43511.1 HAMP domain-containing sensor histidine kinase [bacterium]